MESQSISLGDLFSVELFVGSITFVLGTVLFFLLLLLNLRLNLKTTLLYCCLQLILVVSLSTIFFIFWRFNFDIMIGFLYLPGVLSEVFIMLFFYFFILKTKNKWLNNISIIILLQRVETSAVFLLGIHYNRNTSSLTWQVG